MTWLTWRQHRLEALGAAVLVIPTIAVITAFLLIAQPLLDQANRVCPSIDASCDSVAQAFYNRTDPLHTVVKALLMALPALPGLFIGAPLLAREFEQGTDQLVWSQGITRRRWLFVKLGLLIGATVCISAALAIAGQRWAEAVPIVNLSQWTEFDVEGPAYVSYAFFSLALGVAAGAAIGRTVPAMAAALVGFVGARMAIEFLARPNFQSPLRWELGTNIQFPGNIWQLGDQHQVDLQGHPISAAQFTNAVNICSQVQGTFETCLRDHGVVVVQLYQPGYRFWLFQSIEAAIFTGLGIALLGVAAWFVARRS